MKYLALKCPRSEWFAFDQMSGRIAFKTDANLWRRVIAVHLDSAFYSSQFALQDMLGLGSGRIVNIASTRGSKGYAYVSPYCAAKHCVIALTQSLSREVAAKGITVNAVCPGYSDKEMARQAIANIVTKTSRAENEALAELTCHNAQKRLIRPSELANSVAWLCLPGSEAIAGQSVSVSGGKAS